MARQLLIIDDDAAICRTLQLHFTNEGHDVLIAHSAEDGLTACESTPIQVVILDIRMSGKSGLDILPEIKSRFPKTRVIMITAFHDMDSTIDAMQGGADDYIHKPIDLTELDQAVNRALDYGKVSEDEINIDTTTSKPGNDAVMVGSGPLMKEVFKTIGRTAASSATVLITGESGTGKELVARAIHKASMTPDGPFVAVNCAAMVESLLESDLFGHEKGSFTGAVTRQIGKFALANNGSIFLDEISDLSLSMQAKLLRVLQEKEFVPIGSEKSVKVKVRVITATNANLLEELEHNRFREDLYYRLQVVTIHLPTLRDRKKDIPQLIEHLLKRINREMNKNVNRVSHDVINQIEQYHWPGNVRELENVLTKAVAICPGDIITLDMLPSYITSNARDTATPDDLAYSQSTQERLLDVEKKHVFKVLQSTAWHKGRACEILGISRPRLRRLIALHGLVPSQTLPTATDEEP